MSKMNKKEKSTLSSLKLNPDLLIASYVKEELDRLFLLPPKYDVELEMLKYQYDQEYEERVGLHASAVTGAGKGFCYREQVLSLFYKRSEAGNHPARLLRIFEEGKSIGTKWQRLFMRRGIGEKEDMDVSRMAEEYDLSYTPDGIIELKGKKYVVEIKSQNTNAFQTTKSHPSGIKQLKLYMYLEQINRGFVLVEDKNNQDFKVLMVSEINESDDDIADCILILEKIQKLKRIFLKKKKPPERHEDCSHSSCPKANRCPMRDACWGVGKGRVKFAKQ